MPALGASFGYGAQIITANRAVAPLVLPPSATGKPVRFHFRLTIGRLYSFWVSPDASAASNGYVAAGRPGFVGPRDTVGRDGYPRAGE